MAQIDPEADALVGEWLSLSEVAVTLNIPTSRVKQLLRDRKLVAVIRPGGERSVPAAFLDGEKDGSTADKYVRLTVVLASILFLVGISTHFPYRGVRYGLICLGIALLVLSLIHLSQLPLPPS